MEDQDPLPEKRPVRVTIVIWLIAAETLLFLIKAIRYEDWADPYSYITPPLVGIFTGIWIYPILRRQNWARWVQVVMPALCCLQAGGRLRRIELSWEKADKLMLTIGFVLMLIAATKVFLLMSKSVDGWFRKKPPVERQKD